MVLLLCQASTTAQILTLGDDEPDVGRDSVLLVEIEDLEAEIERQRERLTALRHNAPAADAFPSDAELTARMMIASRALAVQLLKAKLTTRDARQIRIVQGLTLRDR
ncbi:MAG: hypothetical protein AAFX05_10815, partial [Planctomycetota bacterium]